MGFREPRCKTCNHPKVDEIDKRFVEGEPIRRIAKRYGLSASSVQRHTRAHIPRKLELSQLSKEIASADNLASNIKSVENELCNVVRELGIEGNLMGVIRGLSELRRTFESRAKITASLGDTEEQDLMYVDEYMAKQAFVLRTIEPFHEAWQALRAALDKDDEI